MKSKVVTEKAPSPGTSPFSQAIITSGLVFTQGCIHLTTEGKLLEGTTEEQVHQIMSNLQAILEAAEVSFTDVVKATIYVTDMSLAPTVNQVYGSYMSDPYPAREMVCVKELPLGAQIEISMIASK